MSLCLCATACRTFAPWAVGIASRVCGILIRASCNKQDLKFSPNTVCNANLNYIVTL